MRPRGNAICWQRTLCIFRHLLIWINSSIFNQLAINDVVQFECKIFKRCDLA